MDRAALRSVRGQARHAGRHCAALGPRDGAALLVETRADDAAGAARARSTPSSRRSPALPTATPIALHAPMPAEIAQLWNVRKGMFPSVGAMRATGTTVIIEDVAFPVDAARRRDARPAGAAARARLPRGHHLRPRARGQPALRVHAGLRHRGRGASATAASWTRLRSSSSDATTARSRPSTAPAATWRRSSSSSGAPPAYALMREIKQLFDPHGLLNPGVILNDDPEAHLKHLKPLPRRATRSSTSASSAASASRCARRAGSRCRRASASSAGARSRGSSAAGEARRRAARALRLRTASTPAPRAGCARRRARSASRPAC